MHPVIEACIMHSGLKIGSAFTATLISINVITEVKIIYYLAQNNTLAQQTIKSVFHIPFIIFLLNYVEFNQVVCIKQSPASLRATSGLCYVINCTVVQSREFNSTILFQEKHT